MAGITEFHIHDKVPILIQGVSNPDQEQEPDPDQKFLIPIRQIDADPSVWDHGAATLPPAGTFFNSQTPEGKTVINVQVTGMISHTSCFPCCIL